MRTVIKYTVNSGTCEQVILQEGLKRGEAMKMTNSLQRYLDTRQGHLQTDDERTNSNTKQQTLTIVTFNDSCTERLMTCAVHVYSTVLELINAAGTLHYVPFTECLTHTHTHV